MTPPPPPPTTTTTTTATATFTALDYGLFVSVLVLSFLVGVFYVLKERRAKARGSAGGSEELLLGGRSLGIFPVAMSLLASYLSAITVLGVPTEMYVYGTGYWLVAVAGLFTFPLTAFLFLPFFHNLQLDSAYHYLELRFNKATRYMASVLFVMEMLLYMAVVLYAPSLALNQVTGLSLWGSILAVGGVVTFYTSMGGLRAVVWTDTLQTGVVMLGLVGIIVIGSQQLGGLANVWSLAQEGGRINFFDFDPSPFTRVTVWSSVLGSVVGQLTIYGASPTMLQRYMAIRDVRESQLALLVSLPATVLLISLVCLSGLVIYATYHACDPLTAGKLVSKDQILPYFVMDKLSAVHGVPGLFVSCIFSASLSSVSSVLNALSITVLEDIIRPLLLMRGVLLSPAASTTLGKAIGLCGGIIVIGLAFLSSVLGSTVLEIMITVLGIGGGPLLGLFVVGMFMPCVNAVGAMAGLVVSTFSIFWVAIGALVLHAPQPALELSTRDCPSPLVNASVLFNLIDHLPQHTPVTPVATAAPDEVFTWTGIYKMYTVSFLWYPTIAVMTSVIVSIFVSALTGWRNETLHPRLVYKAEDSHCCCFRSLFARLTGNGSVWKYKLRSTLDFPASADDDKDDDFYTDYTDLQACLDHHKFDGFLKETEACFDNPQHVAKS